MEKRTLKYFLDSKNFSKTTQKKPKKTEKTLRVVDGQIVMNPIAGEQMEEEIVTAYTYLTKKGTRKRWTEEENVLFYKCMECCGCDFSMMNLLFSDRDRSNLKQKYKREYKENTIKVENALDNYKRFNMEKFNDLKREMAIFYKIEGHDN